MFNIIKKQKKESNNSQNLALSNKDQHKTDLQKNQSSKSKKMLSKQSLPDRAKNSMYWFNPPQIDPRDNKIFIPSQQIAQLLSCQNFQHNDTKKQLRIWLINIYETIFSDAFYKFNHQQITQGQMKAYCSKNILFNIQQLIQLIKINLSQQIRNKIIKFINKESRKAIGQVIWKYPQSNGRGASRILKKAFGRPDNRQNDQFDMLRFKKIDGMSLGQFRHDKQGNYTSQIMKTLNYVMGISSMGLQDNNQSLSLFQAFKLMLESLFQSCDSSQRASNANQFISRNIPIIMKKVRQGNIMTAQVYQSLFSTSDMSQSFISGYSGHQSNKTKKNYSFKINQKIPSGTKLFTKQQIQSGIFSTPDSSILRIMTKWSIQLRQKLNKSRQLIYRRVQLFKTLQGDLIQISPKARQYLFRAAEQEQKRIKQCFQYLQNQCQLMQQKLAADQHQGMYSNNQDLNVGIFAARTNSCVGRYLLIYINQLIHSLTKIPLRAAQLYAKYQETNDDTLINLSKIDFVTFKIGDLMRAKYNSDQKSVINLLKILQNFSDNCPKVFRLVRIKDRLQTKQNDILINFFFMEKIICQLQISVTSTVNVKQDHYNNFNHFVYELQRAAFGPIAQSACLLVQHDPVIYNYSQRQQLTPMLYKIDRKKKLQFSPISNPQQHYKKNVQKNQMQNKQEQSMGFKEMKQIEKKNIPFFCTLCGNFDKNLNPYFYKFRIHHQNFYECSKCFEIRMMKNQTSRKQLISELFFQQFQPKQELIKKHFSFIDVDKITSIDDILKIKRGFIVYKKSKIPFPQYFQITQFQDDVFFVCSGYHEDQKIRVVFSMSKYSSLQEWQKKLKQYYILTIVKPSQCKIQKFTPQQTIKGIMQLGHSFKIHQYLRMVCKCCKNEKGDELIVGTYFDELKQVIFNRNQAIISQVKKKQKQVLYFGQRKMQYQIPIKQNLPYVKRFYIFENKLRQINSLKKMQNLRIVDISANKISDLPDLQSNKYIQVFNCSNNRLTQLRRLNALQNLIILRCRGNKLTHLSGLQRCYKLQKLYCQDNAINSLKSLAVISNLIILWCTSNKLKSLSGIQSHKNLQQLCFQMNQITTLQQLKSCSKLRIISCHGNKIQNLNDLQFTPNLQWLLIMKNKLKNLRGLQNCLNLRSIKCFGNQISSLQGIQNCISLQQIQCGQNKPLTQFPHLLNLKRLRYIQATQCNIKTLKGLHGCESLEKLLININKLTSLTGLQESFKLLQLNCSYNQITDLAPLKNSVYLQYLVITGNPIEKQKIQMIVPNFPHLQYLITENSSQKQIQTAPISNQIKLQRKTSV